MKDVELGYIDRLAQKKAISSHLAKTLRKISENRFNNSLNFGNRRGSGEVDPSHYNDYDVDHSTMIKGKKNTDTTLSAINIEDHRGKLQHEEEKHDRKKSKVSYIKSPKNILNDPSHLNIVTAEQVIQPSQSVLSNIMIQE